MLLHTLRLLVAAFGALVLAIGVLGPLTSNQPIWTGIYFIALGAGAIIVAVLGDTRYLPRRRSPESGPLQPTDERFVDPTSGQRLRVWIDPASGERAYLPDGESPPD
jgi:hypothetical protein